MDAGATATRRNGHGVCFGFEPRTTIPLQYLRPGTGDPLELSEETGVEPVVAGAPVREWRPPANPLHARLYRDGAAFRLWVEGGGWYGIEPKRPAIVVPRGVAALQREERLWSIPSLLCFVERGDVPLHGAAVEIDGGALVLCGPSRSGKTTLAAALLGAGHRVLSEDLSCCRPGDQPTVLPGPAMLRVRRDSYERLRLPGIVVGEDDDRVHLSLDGDLRGDGNPVPLRAIVMLRTATVTGRERVPPHAAMRDLWALSLKLPDDEDRARCFHGLVQLVETTPVWNLHRPLSYSRLGSVIRELESMCRTS